MSIIIIRGPDKPMQYRRDPLTEQIHPEIIASLVDSAVCAGRMLSIRSCGSSREVIEALTLLETSPPEVLLIDPGISLADATVCIAMRRINVPFVEIHDDAANAGEPELGEAPLNRIGVVHGYRAQGYTVAMFKALDHLGCAECRLDYHVGT